jgi:hypothetical protein
MAKRLASWIPVTCIGLALSGLLYLCSKPHGPEGLERDAAAQLVMALQAHRERNGRFPQRLQELVPREIPALPDVNGWLVYAAEPDGSQCWLLDQVVWDAMNEYDCRERRWRGLDISQSHAWTHPNRQRIEGSPAR